MPNIKSAKKRVKVNEKKNLRNRIVKSGLHTSLKKFETVAAEDAAKAVEVLPVTVSAVDKAASKGVISKNAANRKKARLAKRLNKAAE